MDRKISKRVATGLTAVMATFILQACDPVPRRTLTKEEKVADMYWIYSQFGENYAPLEYKAGRFGFEYEELKKKYLADAEATKTNEEFYDVMFKFVSQFKDAHTSATLSNSPLPNRVKVAYLGFNGKRKGDALLITELLPTIDKKESKFPLKVGERILKLDGVPLKDVIDKEMVNYRNLGQPESNYTFHMNRIFTRLSNVNGLPPKSNAVLTVVSSDNEEREVTLPWVIKDVVVFKREQKEATKKVTEWVGVLNDRGEVALKIRFVGFDGRFISPTEDRLERRPRVRSFRLADSIAGWTTEFPLDKDGSPLPSEEMDGPAETLKKVRELPEKAIIIPSAKTYPAYIVREKLRDADGKQLKDGGSKLIGYVLLNTFSPAGTEENVVKEFKQTLTAFQEMGVTDLVIDLINNGGGSLGLGMELAQALSNEKVVMSEMQFRLSDTWLDEFESGSLSAPSDAEAEIYRRVYETLREDKAKGLRLSRPMSAETLTPFALLPNKDLERKFNLILLTNEMCASMCDIFTAILKDNKLAKVVGSKTMGAGGNVVDHEQAPNSHLMVRQTESLVLRRDGTYIENNGIEPDVAVDVTLSANENYKAVKEKALDLLTRQSIRAY